MSTESDLLREAAGRIHITALRAAATPPTPAEMQQWISLMDPRQVGDALATWLRHAAREAELVGPNPAALTFAQAVTR